MKGDVKIINSNDDFIRSKMTEDKLTKMATLSVRYDDAIYPLNYNRHLTVDEEGYIEPKFRFEEELDQRVIDKFKVLDN